MTNEIQFTAGYWAVLLPVIFMLGDFVTGYIGAWVNKCIDSGKMRTGAAHKGSEILALLLVWTVQQALIIPIDITAIFAVYLVFMEANSIIENLDKIGVPIPKFLKKRINNVLDDIDKED